jgi:hypothetical protein
MLRPMTYGLYRVREMKWCALEDDFGTLLTIRIAADIPYLDVSAFCSRNIDLLSGGASPKPSRPHSSESPLH